MLKKWFQLLLCLLGIGLFMFVLAPLGGRLPMVQPLAEFIDERDIDAGALFYTEVEEAAVAELNMRSTMDHVARQRK